MEIFSNFGNNEIQKEVSQFICLSVILIYSVFRTGKNYYFQMFIEECEYVFKENMSEYITDEIEISSDDSNRERSDEENCDEKNSDENNFDEEN